MSTMAPGAEKPEREQAKLEFQRLLKNTVFFSEYRRCRRFVERDETPYMFIQPLTLDVMNPRVLITDKRVLVIRLGLGGAIPKLMEAHKLGNVPNASIHERGCRADVSIALSPPESALVTSIPAGLAKQLAAFCALSSEQRAARVASEAARRAVESLRPEPVVGSTPQAHAQVKLEFERLLKHRTYLAEYEPASSLLQRRDEVPYMFAWVRVTFAMHLLLLMTDKRVLLFQRGFTAASTRPIKVYLLTEMTNVSVRAKGTTHADLEISFGPADTLTVTRLPIPLANQVGTFLPLPQVERTGLAKARLQAQESTPTTTNPESRPAPTSASPALSPTPLGPQVGKTDTPESATATKSDPQGRPAPTRRPAAPPLSPPGPIVGKTGTLELHDGFVRLDHREFHNVIETYMDLRAKGKVTDVPFDSIVGIHVEKPKLLSVGFIHFAVKSLPKLLITLDEAFEDENSIVMNERVQYEQMLNLKAYIEAAQHRAVELARAEEPQHPYLSEISGLAYDTAMGQCSSEMLKARVPELVRDGGVSPAQLEKAVFEAFDRAVSEYLEDGLLSPEEEARLDCLEEALQPLGIPLDGLAKRGSVINLAKAMALRQLMEGALPETRQYFEDWQLPFVFLKSEQLIWAFAGVSYYRDTVRRQYVGGSVGGSVRIAKGVYVRASSFRGNPIDTTRRELIDQGFFAVTDRHVYFSGSATSFRVRHEKLVAIHPYDNGAGIERDTAAAMPEVFLTGDGWFTYNLLRNVTLLDRTAT